MPRLVKSVEGRIDRGIPLAHGLHDGIASEVVDEDLLERAADDIRARGMLAFGASFRVFARHPHPPHRPPPRPPAPLQPPADPAQQHIPSSPRLFPSRIAPVL